LRPSHSFERPTKELKIPPELRLLRVLRKRISDQLCDIPLVEVELDNVFLEADLLIDAHAVVVAEEAVMNEVGYRLKASFEWTHIDV
jgi:hypothetical protein